MRTTIMSTTKTQTNSEVRAARWHMLVTLLTTVIATLTLVIGWLFKKTWRHLLPVYWILTELAVAWLSGPLGVAWSTVAFAVIAAACVAVCWPARSRTVRAWRGLIALVLGGIAVATTAGGGNTAMAAHPTLTVFVPALAGVVLGWPWWHHLRQRPPVEPVETQPQEPATEEPAAPVVDPLTAYWARRWQSEVVGEGVCEGTTLVHAISPRPGVTEAIIRLAPGSKPKQIVKTGTDIEVAMDLDEGTVGWRTTGKAAKLQISIAERSYIADGVPWTGTTCTNGRCQITTFADGSPGHWVFSRPNFGVLGGLVVGSSGAGKSRALGALIANLLDDGWQTIVGDPQNGQSLPDWKDTVEYHAGVDAVVLLLRRYHAEVMRRSLMLADVGVNVFDENDPRVQKLGLRKTMTIIDECQLVLIPNTPIVVLAEQIAETMRKTGCGLILATQLPQMRSLGGSIRLRDALVGGNALVLRLSNRGSGTTILPDGFVGDPFAIEPEIDGKTTAGMGYLRHSQRVGMLSRVPALDETAVAATITYTPVQWQVPPVDPNTPLKAPAGASTTASGNGAGSSAVDRLRTLFGGKPKHAAPAEEPATSADWVLACLRRGPASAQALLDRPDCPVGQARLYSVLEKLGKANRIIAPEQRGGPYTIAS
jgi:hypothetical protein